MTEPQRHRRAVERRSRIRALTGLMLILIGVAAIGWSIFAVMGWWGVPLCLGVAVLAIGWYLATDDTVAGTGTSPGTPGPGTESRDLVAEVDTEHPDPGQFIPGAPNDPPGTFIPPPPSRDESRDYDRP